MTLHLGLPTAHSRSTQQQQEIREARRLLKERVRNDWFYPALPAWQGLDSGRPRRRRAVKEGKGTVGDGKDVGGEEVGGSVDSIAGFRFHAPSLETEGKGGLGFEPTEWRERSYSSASSGDDEEAGVNAASGKEKESEYKFDGPESVGSVLDERRKARKRKRQVRLEEELKWNDGLQHWTTRRDAWCEAHTPSQVRELEMGKGGEDASAGAARSTEASPRSTPRTSTSSQQSNTAAEAAGDSSEATTPDPGPTTTISTSPLTKTTTSTSTPPESTLLIPVAPQILTNHPVRRKITASMYSEIYTKIIQQSRTPSVPINLRTLVHALIKGWKDDGEWPPKPGMAEPSIGRKKSEGGGGGFKNGVKAVGRALRLTTGAGSSNAGVL